MPLLRTHLCFPLLDFFYPTPFGSYPFHSCPIFFLLPVVLASVWIPNTSEMVCFLILSISFCFTVISAGTSINHFLQGTVLKSSSAVHSSLVSIIQWKSASFDKKHFKHFLQVTRCDNLYSQICDLLFLSKHLAEVYAYRSNFSYHREENLAPTQPIQQLSLFPLTDNVYPKNIRHLH